jgi:transcription-repair coupling factor (superfamily II helicase)
MALAAIVRAMGRLPITTELLSKLDQQGLVELAGATRSPRGLVASTLAQTKQQSLCVITATLEEAGRWAALLECLGWPTVHFYPTSEASPYEPFDLEAEMTWGQLQVLADLLKTKESSNPEDAAKVAIVATERALQPHLPPPADFANYCLTLSQGMTLDLSQLGDQLARLGYERVTLVETEGQWSRRGDIVDIFPVAAELPVRLELFDDQLDKLREFDPTSQRSLDRIEQLLLTPTSFSPIILASLTPAQQRQHLADVPSADDP